MIKNSDTQLLASRSQWFIPLLLLLSLIILLLGLSMPVMRMQQLVFWKEDFTILHGVGALLSQGDYLLGTILFLFSICFPVLKLSALLYLWFRPLTQMQRQQALDWLHRLSKWSMLDVFVIAILIVLSKSGAGFKIEPRIGLYLFAIAVIASSLLTSWVSKVANKSKRLRD